MSDTTDSILTWPEWLPIPVREEYSYQPTDRRTSTEMDIMSVRRPEFDTDETPIDCHVVLQTSELAFFEAFEKHLLRQGSVWFHMPIYTSYGTQFHKVRYRERPKFSDIFANGEPAGMRVTFALETDERKTLTEEEVEFIYTVGLPTIKDIVSKLHPILHVKMPGITIIPDYWIYN